MKAIIISIVLLSMFLVGVYYKMEDALTKFEKSIVEIESIDRALYSHKLDCYKGIISRTITTLEGKIKKVEKVSGINILSIVVGKDNPTSLRCRLDQQIHTGESCDPILHDVNQLLREVILLECVVDAQPGAHKQDLIDTFRNMRYENRGEVPLARDQKYLNITDRQLSEIGRVNRFTEADVPEEKIAWQREQISGR